MVTRQCSNGGIVGSNASSTYFVQGQAGAVSVDGSIANQPRYIVPSGNSFVMDNVYVTLGKPGVGETTVQIVISSGNLPNTATDPIVLSTYNIVLSSGIYWRKVDALEGSTVSSMQHIQSRVSGAGADAEHLNIHFWGNLT